MFDSINDCLSFDIKYARLRIDEKISKKIG